MGKGKSARNTSTNDSPFKSNNQTVVKNLAKCDLGGVIFGCTSATFPECITKQLFGLPSVHFSYVKNIEPGMPLFLFNYTERTMHGVFEAAGHGQLNIDPYAWTDSGKERTAFPSQVRICIRKQCYPLAEKDFKKAIEGNYHRSNHFYFELDYAQTKHLITLFAPSSPSSSFPYTPASMADNPLHALPISRWIPPHMKGKSNSCSGVASECSLVPLSMNCRGKEAGHPNALIAASVEHSQTVNTCTVPVLGKSIDGDQLDMSHSEGGMKTMFEKNISCHGIENEEGFVLCKLREQHSEQKNLDAASDNHGDDAATSYVPMGPSKTHELANAMVLGPHYENVQLLGMFKELSVRTAALEKKHIESEQQMQLMKREIQDLKDCLMEHKKRSNPYTSVTDGHPQGSNMVNSTSADLFSNEVIYLMGGYNGKSWLAALDSFHPSSDTLTPLKPMSCIRAYASAAALNGNFYVLGGGNGADSWYNTVECYNRHKDEWTFCPPLLQRKGSLASATIGDKIYAIGGGDGQVSFSSVEMLDPFLGRWISNTSTMIFRRFAPAAAELHGALYAVGGYDGQGYLRSAERYDPREGFWTRLPDMNTKRGCHSLAVLNETLFAIGGYDGDGKGMVPSVEAYDPRFGSWIGGEPMNYGRGYAAAAVLGDSIFMIGGIEVGWNIVETVEYYREGSGWTKTNLKTVGNRSFFSAILL